MKFLVIILSLNEAKMINRFRDQLITSGIYNDYLDMPVSAFNPAAIPELACRNLVSVGYDSQLYDCDVNRML